MSTAVNLLIYSRESATNISSVAATSIGASVLPSQRASVLPRQQPSVHLSCRHSRHLYCRNRRHRNQLIVSKVPNPNTTSCFKHEGNSHSTNWEALYAVCMPTVHARPDQENYLGLVSDWALGAGGHPCVQPDSKNVSRRSTLGTGGHPSSHKRLSHSQAHAIAPSLLRNSHPAQNPEHFLKVQAWVVCSHRGMPNSL